MNQLKKNFFFLFPRVCIFDFCKNMDPVFTFYFWLINLILVFQVSLNFDKEILEIQCQIYILIKKVIILRKI